MLPFAEFFGLKKRRRVTMSKAMIIMIAIIKNRKSKVTRVPDCRAYMHWAFHVSV